MSRFTLTANSDATEQDHVPYVLLCSLDFTSGVIRLNSSDRSYVHAGNTYSPFGSLASIGPVKENGELVPESLEFTLPGVDSSLITTALTENYVGRAVSLWVAYLDDNLQFVATPQIIWEGFMDQMNIQGGEDKTATIQLICESRLIRWGKSSGWLYTHEHQRLVDATDDFLSYVALMVNRLLKWGGFSAHTPGTRIPGERNPGDDRQGGPAGGRD
jgi:hypothetical protein